MKGKQRAQQKSVASKNTTEHKKIAEKSKTLQKSRAELCKNSKENGVLFSIETILKSSKKTLNESQNLKKDSIRLLPHT